MKPNSPSSRTDYCFHSGLDQWRGFSSPGGDEGSNFGNFRKLSRQFLLQSAREYAAEMAVFGLIVAASGWLVIYMVVTVISLLSKGQP